MTDAQIARAKPCIALMGEFSAGKSTLANLLIGSDPLPVQVVATQLPPVWISYGEAEPFRTDLEGNQFPIDLENLAEAPLEDTAYIKIFCEEDILQQCDLLDMPGISDPNMSTEVWQRMISKADGVLWCSHATQAWRQSEAAVWADMPEKLYDSSLLLLTRIDKIVSERDRKKVIHRVSKETQGLFRACLPVSLLQATREQENYELWAKSGAEELARSLAELLRKLNSEQGLGLGRPEGEGEAEGLKIPGLEGPEMPQAAEEQVEDVLPAGAPPKIMPRRVVAPSASREPPD